MCFSYIFCWNHWTPIGYFESKIEATISRRVEIEICNCACVSLTWKILCIVTCLLSQYADIYPFTLNDCKLIANTFVFYRRGSLMDGTDCLQPVIRGFLDHGLTTKWPTLISIYSIVFDRSGMKLASASSRRMCLIVGVRISLYGTISDIVMWFVFQFFSILVLWHDSENVSEMDQTHVIANSWG